MPSIAAYLRASYPALFIRSFEENRVLKSVEAACKEAKRKLFTWTCTDGLVDTEAGSVDKAKTDPLKMLEFLLGDDVERRVIVAKDLHVYLKTGNPILMRRIKDVITANKQTLCCLVIVGAQAQLPPELEKEITLIDLPLPSADELKEVIHGIISATPALKAVPDELMGELTRAAGGLTFNEAENAFTLSIVQHKAFVPRVVADEKAQTLKKNGILEVIKTDVDMASIGGLDVLKDWMRQRTRVFSPEARAFGLPTPRGCLVGGVPGNGKSLLSKAAANILDLPLLRLDAGRLFGSLVGQTEQNLRTMIETAEAASPCILWIDEFEKAFAGTGSSGGDGDSGTTKRMFGSFLTWMQEKKAPVFIIATANNVSQLPAELLRKGRWDQIWFVDLPSKEERAAIWAVQIKKYGRKPEDFNVDLLAAETDQFVGAEIESLFVEALHRAFDRGVQPTTAMLKELIAKAQPMAKGMEDKIRAMREMLASIAENASSRPDAVSVIGSGRSGRRLDTAA